MAAAIPCHNGPPPLRATMAMASHTFSWCPSQLKATCLLDLVALLATRGGGELSVTVAITEGNAPQLEPLLAVCPSVGVVTLPFPSSPLLPAGCGENTRDLPFHLFRMFIPALAELRAPLLAWCKAQAPTQRVTAVVSDLFTGWARPLAAELGARHVTFSPCSALHVAFSCPLWRDMPQRPRAADADADDDDDDEAVVTFPDVRGGAHSFPWRRMPITYRLHKVGDEPSETIRQIYLWSLLDTECVVLNSFVAFEPTYLDDCRRSPLVPRVLAVGPLSEARATTSGNRGGMPAVAPSEVAAWLDAFADGSVVYVSFGTQHALSPEQAACVADALARSSAAFVWAAGTLTVLPEGFEVATASRGMVIRGWAPQVEILRHRAVGWFLMHCGMNAVLEAASAGVAMLTWPMGADHFFNKIVVEEAGVAMHVAEGADTVPDAGRMAEAIAAAVGDQGKAVRERAVELGRKAAAAVAEGGSSYVDFQELVHMLAKVD